MIGPPDELAGWSSQFCVQIINLKKCKTITIFFFFGRNRVWHFFDLVKKKNILYQFYVVALLCTVHRVSRPNRDFFVEQLLSFWFSPNIIPLARRRSGSDGSWPATIAIARAAIRHGTLANILDDFFSNAVFFFFRHCFSPADAVGIAYNTSERTDRTSEI